MQIAPHVVDLTERRRGTRGRRSKPGKLRWGRAASERRGVVKRYSTVLISQDLRGVGLADAQPGRARYTIGLRRRATLDLQGAPDSMPPPLPSRADPMQCKDGKRETAVHRSTIPSPSRRERFLASWYWLILRNAIGWLLILLSFVAGPLVPGPGGIPLFLIGFALISFPGKRRLTARVLRGKPVRLRRGPFLLISLGVALALAALALPLARSRFQWVAARYSGGPSAAAALYAIAVAVIGLIALLTPPALNLLLRLVAAARHKFRPWLRHHHIRLLPPRWRTRRRHEPGVGPFRLPDEILKFHRRRK